MGDPVLQIQRIYGTSSNGLLNFAVSKNLVAYIASGGVVVAHIDRETGQLSSQRFFCANNASISQQSVSTSAYSYLNMIQQPHLTEDKDSFGIPKLAQTVVINETQNLGEMSSNSTPKGQQQKMKTISCIALSPDGKLLAVGESGSQPRILLFSLASDSNSYPFLNISEHSFGVSALHFSPDSKYLLSAGDTHDGFLYLWRLNGLNATIMGVNKCTSQINGVLWNEDSIVTYGVRYIKTWKFEEFEKKSMIHGKNVILGDFINGNFVYATAVMTPQGEDDVLFLTSLGEICGYDCVSNCLTLRYRHEGDAKMGALLSDLYTNRVWVTTDKITELPSDGLAQILLKDNDGNIDSPSKVKFVAPISCVHQLSERFLIYITSNEEIQLFNTETQESTHLIDSLSKSVNGVKKTSSGTVISWTKEGVLKAIDHETLDLKDHGKVVIPNIPNMVIENHITSLDLTVYGDIIVGDAYGNLSIYDRNGTMIFTIQAHEFSINDLTFFEIDQFQFIISIGRDRMIQVLARKTDGSIDNAEITTDWSVYQTLADHKGNLLQLIFHDNKIYVSSADRSISIHKFEIDGGLVAVNKEKTISVKSTPTAIAISSEEIVVCTMDKQMTGFNLNTLESVRSLKLLDEDNESLLVDNIIITEQNHIICSCSDKSIRVFHYINGRQICVNWGHSEPIKFLLQCGDHLITLSNSGCLFNWSLTQPAQDATQKSTIQKYNDIATPPKAMRKIKKPVSQITTPRRTLNHSPLPRSPQSTRLQSTAKMTPSKLTTNSKTTLSPSPSPSVKATTRLSPKSTPSVMNKRSSIQVSNKTRLQENIDENHSQIDELIRQLKSFKTHMDTYAHEEVMRVKKEITSIFQYEEEILDKYNNAVLDAVKQLIK
jgi:WD40 repeat protein